jgi:hypothetical protein
MKLFNNYLTKYSKDNTWNANQNPCHNFGKDKKIPDMSIHPSLIK